MAAKHSSNPRINPAILLTSVAVAFLVVIVVVVISLLGGRSQSDQDSGSQIPENQLLVNDIYEGERLIPKFDIPQNQYDTAKFTQENGFTFHEGAVQGVDVSEHQGNIDWQQVKDAGMEFLPGHHPKGSPRGSQIRAGRSRGPGAFLPSGV